MIYEYLIFNCLIISGPLFVFFWKSKGIIKPSIKPLLLSILLAGSIFAIWDQLVVNYFWFFNNQYITGLYLFDLPIEEILFFITVPFGCLLLWVNYNHRFNKKMVNNFFYYPIIFILLFSPLLFFYGKIYSASVLLVFFGVFILDYLLKTKLFLRQSFIIFVFLITNILTFIFNLYLTARPIVIYNEEIKTNINIITIPIEDFIFGMALIALTIIIYEKIFSKKINIVE